MKTILATLVLVILLAAGYFWLRTGEPRAGTSSGSQMMSWTAAADLTETKIHEVLDADFEEVAGAKMRQFLPPGTLFTGVPDDDRVFRWKKSSPLLAIYFGVPASGGREITYLMTHQNTPVGTSFREVTEPLLTRVQTAFASAPCPPVEKP